MLGMPSVSLLLLGAAGWAAASEGATRACPQHLVVMVADQMSYTPDHEGGQAMTPNLDRLREEGVEVKHAYATFPACSPNRAALLTGRYPSTVGVATNRAHHPLPVPGFARDGHAGDVADDGAVVLEMTDDGAAVVPQGAQPVFAFVSSKKAIEM